LKQPLDWSATSNDLTEHSLGIDKTVSDIYIGLGLMGRKKRDRVQDVSPTGEIERESEEKEVIKNYDNREFLEALQQGNTEKSQGRKIAIIGDPGAGKTTLLKMIGESLLSQAENIVVWISLADLQGQKLEDYLYQRAGVNIAEEQNRFQEWFKQESVCLLLDGVDEMGEASASSQLGSELSLQSWLTSARIILTCRLNTWDAGKNTFSGFDVFRTLEFTPDQVNQFIQKWFAQKTERGEQLKTELQNPQHSRLRELIKNPLRLTMLCSIWEGDNLSSLPETQAKLYRLYVDWFYDWKYDRFRISNQERQELNKRLGQLAIQKLDAKTSHFRLLERQDRIGEILGNYFETALQLGWLEQVGVASESLNQKVYTFLHPTFQEYFAACAIDDWDFFLPRQHRDRPVRDQNGEYKRYRIFESQWKQVILLWVGRRDRVDQVKEEQERKEFIFHLEDFEGSCSKFDGYRIRTHCLIAACIPELSGYCWMLRDNPESPWADEFVKYIVRLAVVNRIPQAQEALKETDSHRVGRFSIAHLDDEYPWVRWAAAEALQGNTDSAVVLALLARLNDENGRVREAAALALAGNTDSAVVLALLARLDDENERVRWAAALALAGNTDSAVVLAFLARLDDENGRVREAAALALAGNTDSAVVLALLARLDDENGRVREANVL
jgi:energy-coupling factor transporter ATP-binding protein EcfA2